MVAPRWTHPSVTRLLEGGVSDPFAWIERKARDIVLRAMEEGWTGPPYDPFKLADSLSVELVARQDLDDARLVSTVTGSPRIEFNPQRRPARVRFSVAHELGHLLFEDYADRPRFRDVAERRGDDWQLEILCNIAAAEFLMPPGALPIEEADDLDLARLLEQRARLGVSTEALLRRVVRLTRRSVALFAAARIDSSSRFRIDYVVPSRAWKAPVAAGDEVTDSIMMACTAVGYSDHREELWNNVPVQVQAVGIPPYPGDTFPRLVGLLEPATPGARTEAGIHYVRGDAADPRGEGPAIITHVTNNEARRWGGRGFATTLAGRFPGARDAYASWEPSSRRLGALHLVEIAPETWIASLVAQSGYGPALPGKPRLRLGALREALEALAQQAQRLNAGVHMPLIGTGQGGMEWAKVRDLIVEELIDRHVPVTVYVLPDAPMPVELSEEDQLTLL